jgi:hypothetical protein
MLACWRLEPHSAHRFLLIITDAATGLDTLLRLELGELRVTLLDIEKAESFRIRPEVCQNGARWYQVLEAQRPSMAPAYHLGTSSSRTNPFTFPRI